MRFLTGFILGLIIGAKHSAFVLIKLSQLIDWFCQYLQKQPPTPPIGS